MCYKDERKSFRIYAVGCWHFPHGNYQVVIKLMFLSVRNTTRLCYILCIPYGNRGIWALSLYYYSVQSKISSSL